MRGFGRLPDRVLQPFDDLLNANGFERVNERKWVGPSHDSIRQIFSIQALKVALYVPKWGFGVDFVPCAHNRKLAWKRTTKSADYDLTIDRLDLDRDIPDRWYLHSESSDFQAALLARESWRLASLDFARVQGLADLVAMYEARDGLSYKRFGPKNYVQTDIAWGLTLLALGQGEQGEAHLARFRERFDVAPDEPLLVKAEESARRMGVGGR